MDAIILLILFGIIYLFTFSIMDISYRRKTMKIQDTLGIRKWLYNEPDDYVVCKSSKSVEEYNYLKYFTDKKDAIDTAEERLTEKEIYAKKLEQFLYYHSTSNKFFASVDNKIEKEIKQNIFNCSTYNIMVYYKSPKGKSQNHRLIRISHDEIQKLIDTPQLLMTKSEQNKFFKQQAKESLEQKRNHYFDVINKIIDYTNYHKKKLIIKSDKDELDKKISFLLDNTIHPIKKIKDSESEEWNIVGKIIKQTGLEIEEIIQKNNKINEYYESQEFQTIKEICDDLIKSQMEFNDYIKEKADAITSMLGVRVIRNSTTNVDEYNYMRTYEKEISPFTAEVSAQVFSSAENSPMEYIIKYFYPNKDLYPEQIAKLKTLIEELQTLTDARRIIEDNKKEYKNRINNVPKYVLENDEAGFYSRLGFADINENTLLFEYKFSYTSNGGITHRDFTVPMSEENIITLINLLQSKLTNSTFSKEQRALMTQKLRAQIKERDNYTCQNCGNSTYKEPNLLLEIDHIIPVSKGGLTEENNLQTLCWKCNRAKSNK